MPQLVRASGAGAHSGHRRATRPQVTGRALGGSSTPLQTLTTGQIARHVFGPRWSASDASQAFGRRFRLASSLRQVAGLVLGGHRAPIVRDVRYFPVRSNRTLKLAGRLVKQVGAG